MNPRKSLSTRIGLIVLFVGLLASLTLHSSAAATQSTTFTPVADAYASSAAPATNNGTGTTLRVDASPIVNSYIRFSVSGLGNQPVAQAQLKIYANSASTQGLTSKAVADTAWGETTLNYSNAPLTGATLGSSPAVASGTWVTLDVTSFVAGDGLYSFGVSTPGTTAISLASRESGVHAPQLIVTVNTASTPTATQPAATNTPKPGGQTLTLVPTADAYIDASNASANYGSGTTLRVDSSPVVTSYLRFSVAGLSGQPITQALLKIHANSASTQGLVAKTVTDTTWGETTITPGNAPATGSELATSPAVTSGSWISLDVTSYVTSEGSYSFGISTPGTTAISLSSRESGANAPQLVLTLNGASTPAPTGVPTNTSIPPTTTVVEPTAAPTSIPPTNTAVPPTATSIGPTLTDTPVPPTTTPVPPTTTPGNPTPTQPVVCNAVILTKGPTLIYTGNNTQMRVFWQWTANPVFTVLWGTSTSYGTSASVSAKDTTSHLYQYDISGLTPGTRYYYQVVTGSQCASGSFYTAPDASATSVKFFSYGDTRTNGSAHNGLAGQINAIYAADPAFQTLNLHVGDWVSSDSESAWTGEWFASSLTALRKQDASLSDIGVRGNHESGATYWKRYWPEPFQPGGLYWSFDYGPMHVTMIDQYTAYSAGSTQFNWIKADLANTTKLWKVVVLHEPGWSAGGGHANNTTVQNDLQPLFQQYGVAVVVGGHNHYYARASVSGVTHLTMGGGGAPLYSPASGQPNIVTTYNGYSFGQFTISGNTLTAKIISNSGSVVDSFTITK